MWHRVRIVEIIYRKIFCTGAMSWCDGCLEIVELVKSILPWSSQKTTKLQSWAVGIHTLVVRGHRGNDVMGVGSWRWCHCIALVGNRRNTKNIRQCNTGQWISTLLFLKGTIEKVQQVYRDHWTVVIALPWSPQKITKLQRWALDIYNIVVTGHRGDGVMGVHMSRRWCHRTRRWCRGPWTSQHNNYDWLLANYTPAIVWWVVTGADTIQLVNSKLPNRVLLKNAGAG